MLHRYGGDRSGRSRQVAHVAFYDIVIREVCQQRDGGVWVEAADSDLCVDMRVAQRGRYLVNCSDKRTRRRVCDYATIKARKMTSLTAEVVDEVIRVLSTGKAAYALDDVLYTLNPDGDGFDNLVRGIRAILDGAIKKHAEVTLVK